MTSPLNLAHSIFTGYNDKRGILICGYEWGFSKDDERQLAKGNQLPFFDKDAQTTFSNKTPAYGRRALAWRYDSRINRWFELWGHPLSREDLGGAFEKSIVQSNWCNTMGHKIEGNYYSKLLDPEQVENFFDHIAALEPTIILFMGSVMIDVLQQPQILQRFIDIAGPEISPLEKIQKNFSGRRFKIGFQRFSRCSVVSLPHPSSSRGLRDQYIGLFEKEIGELIASFRNIKGI